MPEKLGREKLGHDCTLKFGSQGSLGSAVVQLTNVTLDMSSREVDATTRANQGWERKMSGLKTWTASGDIVYITGDSGGYVGLFDAFNNSTELTVQLIGGVTISGAAYVTKFSETQNLGEPVKASITITGAGKPTVTVS